MEIKDETYVGVCPDCLGSKKDRKNRKRDCPNRMCRDGHVDYCEHGPMPCKHGCKKIDEAMLYPWRIY